MDGENNGSNPIKMDDLGGKHPYFWVDTHISESYNSLHNPTRLGFQKLLKFLVEGFFGAWNLAGV